MKTRMADRRWSTIYPLTGPVYAGQEDREFDPSLEAPVADLLGPPWYIESGSPGGDYVLWLDIKDDGGRVGVSPHPMGDGLTHWVIAVDTTDGPAHQEDDLLITATPQEVADRVRSFLSKHGIVPAIKLGHGPTRSSNPTSVHPVTT